LGIRVGLAWAAANWLLDGLMFFEGPMRMTLRQYAMEIGAAYLMMPIIAAGLAAAFAFARGPAATGTKAD
jgi:hypothetical protein